MPPARAVVLAPSRLKVSAGRQDLYRPPVCARGEWLVEAHSAVWACIPELPIHAPVLAESTELLAPHLSIVSATSGAFAAPPEEHPEQYREREPAEKCDCESPGFGQIGIPEFDEDKHQERTGRHDVTHALDETLKVFANRHNESG